ncbi:MAG: hypothetical protein QM296_13675 [Bacillota bacterium]|nr:hypothetical protein [Bacillota bacterium]
MKLTKRTVFVYLALLIGLVLLTHSTGALRAGSEPEAKPQTRFSCSYYRADGELLEVVELADDEIPLPPAAPELDGMEFSHWYQVDAALEGNVNEPYLFDRPVSEALYLMPCYYEAADPAPPAETETTPPDPTVDPSATAPEAGLSSGADAELPVTDETVGTDLLSATCPGGEEEANPVPGEPADAVPPQEAETDVPEKEDVDRKNPDRTVSIYASWGEKDVPEIGDPVTLHAVLAGYEGLEYRIRWQVKESEAGSWQDVGAEGDSYTLTLSEENLDWNFRVAVDIIDAD